MKKLSLAIAVALAASSVYANDDVNLSDLSSTADAPNNLYDFIDNEKLSGTAYAGAELGGELLLGDQEGSFAHFDMFKIGADFTYATSENVALLMGGEARYYWSGIDTSVEAENVVDRFQFGVQTVAGTTTFGKQCGTIDAYAGFGDIAKEYGIGEDFEDSTCADELLDHRITGENFDFGVSYVNESEAWGAAGGYTMGNFAIGGAVASIGSAMAGDVEYSEFAYSVGVVGNFDKLTAAVKYAANSAEAVDSSVEVDTSAYNVGVAYQFTTNLSVASTYNYSDVSYSDVADATDDWFTVGASYRLNEHVELVTDLKLASETDDKMFLRANVNF